MILTRPHQYYPRQYGLGLRVYRDIRGEGVFSSLGKYARPIGKFLLHNVVKPFMRNNREEIKNVLSKHSMQIIKNLASTDGKPGQKRKIVADAIDDIKNVLQKKTLSEHLRGEGFCNIKRRRKT